jgi:hypothetical protein
MAHLIMRHIAQTIRAIPPRHPAKVKNTRIITSVFNT